MWCKTAQISKKNNFYDCWMFITPKINSDFNCTKMLLWSKSYDSSLNGWQVTMQTSSKRDTFKVLIKIDLEGQGQSTPKTIEILTVLRCVWSKFGDSNWNRWNVIVRKSTNWGKIRLSCWIWSWKSKSTTPKNNRDLNHCVLHLWSKFGSFRLNG